MCEIYFVKINDIVELSLNIVQPTERLRQIFGPSQVHAQPLGILGRARPIFGLTIN